MRRSNNSVVWIAMFVGVLVVVGGVLWTDISFEFPWLQKTNEQYAIPFFDFDEVDYDEASFLLSLIPDDDNALPGDLYFRLVRERTLIDILGATGSSPIPQGENESVHDAWESWYGAFCKAIERDIGPRRDWIKRKLESEYTPVPAADFIWRPTSLKRITFEGTQLEVEMRLLARIASPADERLSIDLEPGILAWFTYPMASDAAPAVNRASINEHMFRSFLRESGLADAFDLKRADVVVDAVGRQVQIDAVLGCKSQDIDRIDLQLAFDTSRSHAEFQLQITELLFREMLESVQRQGRVFGIPADVKRMGDDALRATLKPSRKFNIDCGVRILSNGLLDLSPLPTAEQLVRISEEIRRIGGIDSLRVICDAGDVRIGLEQNDPKALLKGEFRVERAGLKQPGGTWRVDRVGELSVQRAEANAGSGSFLSPEPIAVAEPRYSKDAVNRSIAAMYPGNNQTLRCISVVGSELQFGLDLPEGIPPLLIRGEAKEEETLEQGIARICDESEIIAASAEQWPSRVFHPEFREVAMEMERIDLVRGHVSTRTKISLGPDIHLPVVEKYDLIHGGKPERSPGYGGPIRAAARLVENGIQAKLSSAISGDVISVISTDFDAENYLLTGRARFPCKIKVRFPQFQGLTLVAEQVDVDMYGDEILPAFKFALGVSTYVPLPGVPLDFADPMFYVDLAKESVGMTCKLCVRPAPATKSLAHVRFGGEIESRGVFSASGTFVVLHRDLAESILSYDAQYQTFTIIARTTNEPGWGLPTLDARIDFDLNGSVTAAGGVGMFGFDIDGAMRVAPREDEIRFRGHVAIFGVTGRVVGRSDLAFTSPRIKVTYEKHDFRVGHRIGVLSGTVEATKTGRVYKHIFTVNDHEIRLPTRSLRPGASLTLAEIRSDVEATLNKHKQDLSLAVIGSGFARRGGPEELYELDYDPHRNVVKISSASGGVFARLPIRVMPRNGKCGGFKVIERTVVVWNDTFTFVRIFPDAIGDPELCTDHDSLFTSLMAGGGSNELKELVVKTALRDILQDRKVGSIDPLESGTYLIRNTSANPPCGWIVLKCQSGVGSLPTRIRIVGDVLLERVAADSNLRNLLRHPAIGPESPGRETITLVYANESNSRIGIAKQEMDSQAISVSPNVTGTTAPAFFELRCCDDSALKGDDRFLAVGRLLQANESQWDIYRKSDPKGMFFLGSEGSCFISDQGIGFLPSRTSDVVRDGISNVVDRDQFIAFDPETEMLLPDELSIPFQRSDAIMKPELRIKLGEALVTSGWRSSSIGDWKANPLGLLERLVKPRTAVAEKNE